MLKEKWNYWYWYFINCSKKELDKNYVILLIERQKLILNVWKIMKKKREF